MRPSLLLVEDSETQALQIRRHLEREGFAVERVASAETALDVLGQRRPDIVVLDYHLPGMDGPDLLRQLRLHAATRTVPVLMFTESVAEAGEREGLESGADAYLPKSADPDLLVLRLRALLRDSPLAGAGQVREPAPLRRARLLVAEDEASGDALLAMLLREGHDAVAARGPAEVLGLLADADEPWDCVVVDLAAHDFDGLGLCAAIDAERRDARQSGRLMLRMLGVGVDEQDKDAAARAYASGIDDLVPRDDMGALGLRLRAMMRRKLLYDEAVRAQEEEAANAARASFAEALARANADLEAANRQLRETQGQLVQAAKMASLGELVAGIAHEINNPLAFILAHQGTVERLLGQVAGALPDGSEPARQIVRARDRAASMQLGLQRIQELVLNLRRFSRLDSDQLARLDVPEAVDTVLALLAHRLEDRIVIERHYDAPAQLVCTPALLNQVIMNIVGNAADAVEGKGTVSIHSFISTMPDGGRGYSIAIADSGPGVPEALRERIFEPFFTTKPVGSGTGLGLAIAYGVVRAQGGTIVVADSPLGGACFVVTVPDRQDAPGQDAAWRGTA